MGEIREYKPHRRWTKEEEELLIKYSEKLTESGIAKKLNRPISSVRAKRTRMGIPCFADQSDKMTGLMIAELVGLHRSSIYTTWEKKGFKMKRVGQFKVADEIELIRFMQEHPELWKASKCDYYFFCQYKWFTDRLKREKAGIEEYNHYRKIRNWTPTEISRAKMLKSRGFTHREIGEKLGRSKQSIDHASRRGMLK